MCKLKFPIFRIYQKKFTTQMCENFSRAKLYTRKYRINSLHSTDVYFYMLFRLKDAIRMRAYRIITLYYISGS